MYINHLKGIWFSGTFHCIVKVAIYMELLGIMVPEKQYYLNAYADFINVRREA